MTTIQAETDIFSYTSFATVRHHTYYAGFVLFLVIYYSFFYLLWLV